MKKERNNFPVVIAYINFKLFINSVGEKEGIKIGMEAADPFGGFGSKSFR